MRLPLRAVSLPIVLALLLLVPAVSPAQERTITVRGAATQEVSNDTASLRFSVTKERRSRAAALRIVSRRLAQVIGAIKQIPGVGPGDVTTGAVSIRKVVRNERTLYRASEGVTAILHQPERAGDMISAAVAAGATGTNGPTFFPGDPEAAYNNTLLAAFDQAKAKAAALATRADAILGAPITIEEGAEVVPDQPADARGPRAVSAPTPPTKPGASTVTATVRVVFALE